MKIVLFVSFLVLSSCSSAILVEDCKPHHLTLAGKMVSSCIPFKE
jgi:hypothetical protein